MTRAVLQAAAERAAAVAMREIGGDAYGVIVVITGIRERDGEKTQVGIASNMIGPAWLRTLVQLGDGLRRLL